VDFDRKEDFKSSFKEDRKSNEAPSSVGNKPKHRTAVRQCPGPRTAVPCPQSRAACFFFSAAI